MGLRYHSDYYGWQIYRLYDGLQPKMHYEARRGPNKLIGRNLLQIRKKVKEAHDANCS